MTSILEQAEIFWLVFFPEHSRVGTEPRHQQHCAPRHHAGPIAPYEYHRVPAASHTTCLLISPAEGCGVGLQITGMPSTKKHQAQFYPQIETDGRCGLCSEGSHKGSHLELQPKSNVY